MHEIELTDEELRLVRAAIRSCVQEFGHDEAEVLHAYQDLLSRLPMPAASARSA